MSTDPLSFLLTIIAGAIGVAITFYIKEWLQKRSDYDGLKRKLEAIAGKNAMIIYTPPVGMLGNMGAGLYKIIEINKSGVTLKNEIQTIFIPAKRLLESDIILPADNYEKARLEKLRRDMEDMTDALVEPMMRKMIPTFLAVVDDQIQKADSQLSVTVAMKIQTAFKDAGLEIKMLDEPDDTKSRSRSGISKP